MVKTLLPAVSWVLVKVIAVSQQRAGRLFLPMTIIAAGSALALYLLDNRQR